MTDDLKTGCKSAEFNLTSLENKTNAKKGSKPLTSIPTVLLTIIVFVKVTSLVLILVLLLLLHVVITPPAVLDCDALRASNNYLRKAGGMG